MASVGDLFIQIGSFFDDAGVKAAINGLGSVAKESKKTSTDIEKLSVFVKDNSATFRAAGIALSGFSAGLIALGTKGVMNAANFEQEMAKVATMLDKTSMLYMPAFSEGIQRMSRDFGEGTKSLSDGLYDILSASIPPADAMDVLEAATMTAKAGFTSTAIATKSLVAVLNSYQLAGKDAADVSDWMFATVKRGVFTFEEFAGSIGKVLPLAKAGGVTLEELGAMMATMTRAGLTADEATTALRGTISSLISPTTESAQLIKEWGFNSGASALQTLGLRGVIEKMSGTNVDYQAQIFGNVRALTGMTAALNDTAGFTEDMRLMMERNGQTHKALALATDTTTFKFSQLKESVSGAFEAIGQKLLPVANLLITALTSLLKIFISLPGNLMTLIVILGGITASLTGFAGAALILISILPQLTSGFLVANQAIILITAAFPKLISGIVSMKTAVSAAITPWTLLAAAVAVAVSATLDYFIAQTDTKNAAINTGKSIQNLIDMHKKEIEIIKEKMRDTSLSISEQEELQKKYFLTLNALKKQEIKLFNQTEKEKIDAMKKSNATEDKDYKKHKNELIKIDLEANRITLQDYKNTLLQRLEVAVKGTDEERALIEELSSLRLNEDMKMRDSFLQSMNAMLANYQSFGGMFTEFWSGIHGAVKDGFVYLITNIQDGLSSFSSAAGVLWEGMKKAFINLVAEMATKWVMEHTVMAAISAIFKKTEIASNAAIGASRAAAASAWTLWGALAIGAAIGAGIMALGNSFAKGVRNFKGGMALVGEQGPELVSLPRGSNVFTNSETKDIMSTNNNSQAVNLGNTNITITGSVDKNNVDSICKQIAAAVKSNTIEGIKLAKTISKEGGFRTSEAY